MLLLLSKQDKKKDNKKLGVNQLQNIFMFGYYSLIQIFRVFGPNFENSTLKIGCFQLDIDYHIINVMYTNCKIFMTGMFLSASLVE